MPDLLDQIADETVGSDPKTLRSHLEKVKHPALAMPDMSDYIGGTEPEPVSAETVELETAIPVGKSPELTPEKILEMIRNTAAEGLRAGGTGENAVRNVIEALGAKFLGSSFKASIASEAPVQAVTPAPKAPSIIQVQTFKIPKQKCETPVRVVKLGATKAEGGTRRVAYSIGGATAMPFHSFEGEMPHRSLVAMEVFDKASENIPRSCGTSLGACWMTRRQWPRSVLKNTGRT